MADKAGRSIEPFIEEAQGALENAMDEACRADLRKADTGELIRIEEALQAAANAAKEVVSLRLRRRSEREGKPGAPRGDSDARDTGETRNQADAPVVEEHRVIQDDDGTAWAVVAVYPSSRSVDQGTLPDRFARGWLLFEHGAEVRRHAPVPENWQSLSDAELRSLCHNAEIATRRITPLK